MVKKWQSQNSNPKAHAPSAPTRLDPGEMGNDGAGRERRTSAKEMFHLKVTVHSLPSSCE